MNRRKFAALVLTAPLSVPAVKPLRAASPVVSEGFAVQRTEAEWRARLSDPAYAVMREGATEQPYSSDLNAEQRDGIYHCKGCDQTLYDAATKFDSGTGWPSFTQAIDGAIGTRPDRSWFLTRTEVHCSRCGSHLGHVFDDGPPPTGKRHCLNGVALVFVPEGETISTGS